VQALFPLSLYSPHSDPPHTLLSPQPPRLATFSAISKCSKRSSFPLPFPAPNKVFLPAKRSLPAAGSPLPSLLGNPDSASSEPDRFPSLGGSSNPPQVATFFVTDSLRHCPFLAFAPDPPSIPVARRTLVVNLISSCSADPLFSDLCFPPYCQFVTDTLLPAFPLSQILPLFFFFHLSRVVELVSPFLFPPPFFFSPANPTRSRFFSHRVLPHILP